MLKFCFYIKLGDVRYVAILLSALGQGRSIWEMSIVTYKSALTPAMAIIFERTTTALFRIAILKQGHWKIGLSWLVSYRMPTCKSWNN
jgi:hypothetical protein